MASHGVPRVEPSGTKSGLGKEKELQQINEYQELVTLVTDAITREEYRKESLDLTSKLLILNPEYYTIWNHRRRILQSLFSIPHSGSTEDDFAEMQNLVASDLQFLLPLLIKYPKCYWIWNHRLWLLHQVSDNLPPHVAGQFWSQELGLVGKMLARDSRNFHGWDYRRLVVTQLRQSAEASLSQTAVSDRTSDGSGSVPEVATGLLRTESEFAYTTKMINSNLSNFSAWHNRSKLIPRLLNERRASDEDRRKMFDDELALIHSAVFTDPYDQSLWFYHQYLMSELSPARKESFVHFTNPHRSEYLEREIGSIRELLEDTDDCKWVYQYLLFYTAEYLDMEGENKFVTTIDMRLWLSQLMHLDPLRKGRWMDLAKSLNLQD